MPWFYAVAEHDHELQNPTSPEKIRALGEAVGLGPDSRVLDMACGKAGPATLLASHFGCRIVGVERSPEFVAAARDRVASARLAERVEIVEGDAAAFPVEPGTFDAALCLGASFIWGRIEDAAEALIPSVKPGGFLVDSTIAKIPHHRFVSVNPFGRNTTARRTPGRRALLSGLIR